MGVNSSASDFADIHPNVHLIRLHGSLQCFAAFLNEEKDLRAFLLGEGGYVGGVPIWDDHQVSAAIGKAV